jgi:membrane protein DedA with SNARE-associated domain
MDTLIWLIQDYGYFILFAWTLFEGETIVVLAGFAVYQGYMDIWLVIPIVLVGTIIGDHIYFFLGRFKGQQLLKRYPSIAPEVEYVHQKLEQHHIWIVLTSRFLYGFRTILPIAIGTSKLPTWKFTLLNSIGAIVWGVVFLSLGYVFSGAIETFLGNLKKIEGYVVLAVITIVLLFQFFFWSRRRATRKKVESEI